MRTLQSAPPLTASDEMYDWTLSSGAMGVHGSQYAAMAAATDALRHAAPGTDATVRAVALGGLGQDGYHLIRDIAHGYLLADGVVLWSR